MQAQQQVQDLVLSQLLTFKINNSFFCLPVDQVASVIEMPEITSLPDTPGYIAGSFMHRGKTAVAVVVRELLGLAKNENHTRPSLIITELNGETIGLWIDEIKGLVDSSNCLQSELPPMSMNQGVRHALLHDGQIIFPINIFEMSVLHRELRRIAAERAEQIVESEHVETATPVLNDAVVRLKPEQHVEPEEQSLVEPANDSALEPQALAPAEEELIPDVVDEVSQPEEHLEEQGLAEETSLAADMTSIDNLEQTQSEEDAGYWQQAYHAGSESAAVETEIEAEDETLAALPDPHAGQTAFEEQTYPVEEHDETASHGEAVSSAWQTQVIPVDEPEEEESSDNVVSLDEVHPELDADEQVLAEQQQQEVQAVTTAEQIQEQVTSPALDESPFETESEPVAEIIEFRGKEAELDRNFEIEIDHTADVDVRDIISHAPIEEKRSFSRKILIGTIVLLISCIVFWRQVDWNTKQKLIKYLPARIQKDVSAIISYDAIIRKPTNGPDRLVIELPEHEIRVVRANKVDPILLTQRQNHNARIYRVKKGDTLWGIAERFLDNPFRYVELAQSSEITKPDLIFPGDIVTIGRKIPD